MREGWDGRPTMLWMPDGSGGLRQELVSSGHEYHRLWYEEGMRCIREAMSKKRKGKGGKKC